ncbi:MAG: Mu-like prophage major head subunit gpT family protein [Candidatus Methylomirabilis sp.]|nr:Mu-like prophage major head subunit gpT family protein [Deltaproteobacteria bacterium]
MILNAGTLAALFTGFKLSFQESFASAKPLWERVAMPVPSTTEQELYAWLGTIPGFREWVGDRVIQNLKTHDFAIKNKDFELTVGVPRNKIQDDTYGVYKPLFSEMGRAAKMHPDELVFALLLAGFATPCYDGQYFFDTDHPVLDAAGVAQSVSNFGGGAGTPWFLMDTTRMVRPLIWQKRSEYNFVRMDSDRDPNVFMKKEYVYGSDGRGNAGYGLWQLAYASKQTLDATNYAAARAAMMSLKGDGGRPLNLTPNLLVVPPALEGAALELLRSEQIGGTTNKWRGTAEPLVVALLAA